MRGDDYLLEKFAGNGGGSLLKVDLAHSAIGLPPGQSGSPAPLSRLGSPGAQEIFK